MKLYADVNHVKIIPLNEGKALVHEGITLKIFPSSWTDEQIRVAVGFANLAYSNGFIAGEKNKANSICKLLNLTNG